MKILIGNILHQHAETCGICSTFFPSIGLTGNRNSVKEASASGETDSWSAVQTAGEALTALWVTEPCAALLSDQAWGALSHTSCQPPPPPDTSMVRKCEILSSSQPNIHVCKRLQLTPPLRSSLPLTIHPPTNCKLIYFPASLWEAVRLPRLRTLPSSAVHSHAWNGCSIYTGPKR